MKTKRPVFLNLLQIKFPVPAIASIFHRVSGVVLFLGLPFLLYCWHQARSAEGFMALQQANFGFKVLLWMILSAGFYHALAGLRHLLMDCGLGESLTQARFTAKLVIGLAIVGALLLGVWVC